MCEKEREEDRKNDDFIGIDRILVNDKKMELSAQLGWSIFVNFLYFFNNNKPCFEILF